MDEREADEKIRIWRYEKTGRELREESRVLVERHWEEITAVAEELLRVSTLDDTEVQILADYPAGVPNVSLADLYVYRGVNVAPPIALTPNAVKCGEVLKMPPVSC